MFRCGIESPFLEFRPMNARFPCDRGSQVLGRAASLFISSRMLSPGAYRRTVFPAGSALRKALRRAGRGAAD